MADDPRLADLLVRWAEAEIDGVAISLEELCEGAPELLAPARRRIDQLKAMDAVLEDPAVRDEASTIESAREGAEPRREPDWKDRGFEIVKVLGTGGMGVVYLARQVGLDRLIA